MGVMECSRNGCTNILCDRYNSEFVYICNECFNELVELGPLANVPDFMESKKRNRDQFANSYDVMDNIFPSSNEHEII